MAGKKEHLAEVGKNTQFSKDRQPENPGRKRKLPELDQLLADVLGSENPDESAVHDILKSMLKQALKGNVNAATVLLNRAYGMPKQSTETTVKMEGVTSETMSADKVRDMIQILKGDANSDTETSGKRSKGA